MLEIWSFIKGPQAYPCDKKCCLEHLTLLHFSEGSGNETNDDWERH